MVERRKKLSKEELGDIATVVVQAMTISNEEADRHCKLTRSEVKGIREFLQHKKKAGILALSAVGALAYWALKDIYEVVSHYFSYSGPPPH